MRIFWGIGFGLFLLGGVLYLKWRPLGMAFAIAGFIETIWWTSPSFNFGGAELEYHRLLNNRLFFTNVTLVLVVAAWLISRALWRREEKKASATNVEELP